MNILISTLGSAGDVFPMLGLALELQRRGHAVTFATNGRFEDAVRRNGLPFESIGTEEDFLRVVQNRALVTPGESLGHIIRSMTPAFEQQYDLHERLCKEPDLIAVTNLFGFGARLAQDKFHFPLITVHLQPSVLWSDIEPPTIAKLFGPRWLKSLLYRIGIRYYLDPAVGQALKPLCDRIGLPPVRNVASWWNSPYGVLCLFPEWYCAPKPDWPANLMQADFPLWNDQTRPQHSAELEQFLASGSPPLVFTPGSAVMHAHEFFRVACETCRLLKRRGVLLTEFPEQLPTTLPEGVITLPYVPLESVLARSAAFIHHGGVGSMSQAIAAGIPQVILPLVNDQFDNAARVQKLGVGGNLSMRKMSAKNLQTMLSRLLSDPGVTANCQRYAKQMSTHNGLRLAADLIEARAKRG